MPLEFSGEDVARMGEIRLVVAKAIRPFSHNTEAALAIGALITNARVLIDKYPPERRAAIVEACRLFLGHDNPDQTIHPFDITGGAAGGVRIIQP